MVIDIVDRFFENHDARFSEIGEVKSEVSSYINIPCGSRVLDILVGPGDFTRAVAKSSNSTQLIAGEILQCDIEESQQKKRRDGLEDRIEMLKMDVTHMAFSDQSFDYVVNFSGWGNFTSFSGECMIPVLFNEVNRVLKAKGIFALTFIPPIKPLDYISRIDKELEEFRYLSSKRPMSFDLKFFSRMFMENGLDILETRNFETTKSRILPDEAKEILRSTDYYPSFFPEVKMRPYKEIRERFGDFVDKYGIREYRSKFTLIIGRKNLDS